MDSPTDHPRHWKILAAACLVFATGLGTASCSDSAPSVEKPAQRAHGAVDDKARKVDVSRLTNELLEMWTTTDEDKRHDLVDKLFTKSAVHYIAPANVSIVGSKKIEANVAQVNKENIQRAGLKLSYGKVVVNHNAVQMKWKVSKGSEVVRGGTDFLVLDGDERITKLYMFSGTQPAAAPAKRGETDVGSRGRAGI